MSSTSNLSQVIAYISPELRRQLDQARKQSEHRLSMSAYIEGVLRHHVARLVNGKAR